ncbi:(4Fe-4S)-binding protein [Peptostreptococcaceae bacterium OttesenSCG-928-C18]|nr:(4Fe-4S)-binding protein [Peptostreptococcaceae bacterium OttesenSCG-928-C18]
MTEEKLLNNGYKKYRGNKINVYFNKDLCTHSAYCIKGDHEVFNLDRKPWILPIDEKVDKIIEVIEKCPSSALKYKLLGEKYAEP